MLNWKEVSDGDRFQKTCKVGDSGDYTFVVGKVIVGPYIAALSLQRFLICFIKTHDSESRGQEEAGCTRRTSELFTRTTALKFENAVTKPPRQLSPSYSGLSTF